MQYYELINDSYSLLKDKDVENIQKGIKKKENVFILMPVVDLDTKIKNYKDVISRYKTKCKKLEAEKISVLNKTSDGTLVKNISFGIWKGTQSKSIMVINSKYPTNEPNLKKVCEYFYKLEVKDLYPELINPQDYYINKIMRTANSTTWDVLLVKGKNSEGYVPQKDGTMILKRFIED